VPRVFTHKLHIANFIDVLTDGWCGNVQRMCRRDQVLTHHPEEPSLSKSQSTLKTGL
jgi:hypothetical protein